MSKCSFVFCGWLILNYYKYKYILKNNLQKACIVLSICLSLH